LIGIDSLIQGIVAGGGLIIAYMGIKEYKQNQVLKNKDIVKDIVLPLVDEFDEDHLILKAKAILEDVPIEIIKRKSNDQEEKEDIPIDIKIKRKSNDQEEKEEEDILKKQYNKEELKIALQDHKNKISNWRDGDDVVRGSFDRFLNFLCKLEYMLSLELLNRNEIVYFQYYIDLVAKNEPVLNYIRIYNFALYGKLDPKLNSKLPLIDY
jgi:hypothetical protein